MLFKSCYVDPFTVIIFSFIIRIKNLITHLFQKLIYEIQNNLHQLTTHMSTLIMWHNRFSENKNEAVEAHIPQHRDSKTKKPRHRETETFNPQHRDSKTFFQRTKSHDIEIPRLKDHDIEIPRPKNHDIEFLWNSDPYAPWYERLMFDYSVVFRLFCPVFGCSASAPVFRWCSLFRSFVFRCSWFYSMPMKYHKNIAST